MVGLYSALAGAFGVIAGSLLNHLLTRKRMSTEIAKATAETERTLIGIKKDLADIKKVEAETEKIQREMNNVTALVDYSMAGSGGQVIYDSRKGDMGHDFRGINAHISKIINGIDQPVGNRSQGELFFENGILNLKRTNTDGRFEIWLQAYHFGGNEYPEIQPNELVAGKRSFRLDFEAKVVGGQHAMRVVVKNETTNKWLADALRTFASNDWTQTSIYFQIPVSEKCRIRLDDLDVSSAPSSLHIRNFILTERSA
jgi:hypothetical protein